MTASIVPKSYLDEGSTTGQQEFLSRGLMLEATVFWKIKLEHAMKPGFTLIQSDGMHSIPFSNPVMPSITKFDTLISANSMLHSDMEFFVSPAEARINVSKRDQLSAWDRMRCFAPDDPIHLVTG